MEVGLKPYPMPIQNRKPFSFKNPATIPADLHSAEDANVPPDGEHVRWKKNEDI
jgi:hypothetical protein